MVPYNEKVWATPLDELSAAWISDRVAVVDVEAVLRNVILGEDRTGWGPNSTFRYPLHGGTGHLAQRLAQPFEHRIRRCSPVVAVDAGRREATSADGGTWRYDALLSTMPLTTFVERIVDAPATVRAAAARLRATATHVVGIGLDRPVEVDRNWVYYPEPEVPFHRLTSSRTTRHTWRRGRTSRCC